MSFAFSQCLSTETPAGRGDKRRDATRGASCVRRAAFLINVDKVRRGGHRERASVELFKSRPPVRILIIKLRRSVSLFADRRDRPFSLSKRNLGNGACF